MDHSRKIALKVSTIYIILGILWLVVTDHISIKLAQNNYQLFISFQNSKGWLYIIITGAVLYSTIVYWTKKLLNSQKELQVRDEQYQSLFMYNIDAVLELNLEGKIISMNPQAKALFGYDLEGLNKHSASMLINSEDLGKVIHCYRRAINKEALDFETAIRDAKGEIKFTRCSFVPIIIQGDVIGTYAIARDVTGLRREEELLIMSERTSVIGHLAAAVAHEIRNPLTSLKGFIQLMQYTRELNDEHLDIILQEVERINTISSELLILGKTQEVTYKKIDVRESIRQVFTLMTAQTNLDNVELCYEEVPRPVLILADESQMKQVLINIIKNSIEAITEHGKIDVVLRIEEDTAVLTVQDNGIGMEPERLQRIGQLFYSTKEKGTGIGLAVCQKIIHRHNGEIFFKSERNKGTLVTIRIPLAKEQVVL